MGILGCLTTLGRPQHSMNGGDRLIKEFRRHRDVYFGASSVWRWRILRIRRLPRNVCRRRQKDEGVHLVDFGLKGLMDFFYLVRGEIEFLCRPQGLVCRSVECTSMHIAKTTSFAVEFDTTCSYAVDIEGHTAASRRGAIEGTVVGGSIALAGSYWAQKRLSAYRNLPTFFKSPWCDYSHCAAVVHTG
jgi:hypothetical protein